MTGKCITLMTVLVSTILIISCSNKQPDNSNNEQLNHSTEENVSADDFANYLRSIKKLETPFTIDNLDYEPVGYESVLFLKYKSKSSSWPYGQIVDNGQIISTIEVTIGEDRYAPIIMTYTKDGQKIDSLLPYKKTGWDIDYLSREYLTINGNKEIVVIDSTTTWKLSDKMDRIDDSKTTSTDTVIYKVDDFGKFNIIKGKVNK
jgi:hypothetical protein